MSVSGPVADKPAEVTLATCIGCGAMTLPGHCPGGCAQERKPVEAAVSWWCPQCGGVDAPQPCIGVCIRTPVRWANAEHLRDAQARAVALLARTDCLLEVLSLVAHTRPRPGQEDRHGRAVRERAAAALADI